MNTKTKTNLATALLIIVTFAGLHAQSTAFTYQGRLLTANGPANGSYDLQFALFNAKTNGVQLSTTQTDAAVAVSNGLFTVTVDFGNQYPPSPCWLAIGVRTNGVASFSALSPRQPLTPTPYAINADNSSNLLGSLPAVQISGSVGNTQLANSSVTVNAGTGLSGGGTVPLGGSTTLNNAGVTSLTGGGGVTVSASSGAVTLGSTATSANMANTMVGRDGSGNFAAGSITLAGSLNLPSPTTTMYSGSDLFLFSDVNQLNFFAGPGAGNLTVSGYANTAIGPSALHNNTSGYENMAGGYNALSVNTSGGANTAYGAFALGANTSGNNNTAIGHYTLEANTTGSNNAAIGDETLISNTNGYENTAVGNFALHDNLSGSDNTAIGNQALYSNTGDGNTAVGYQALYYNTGGGDTTAVGYQAGGGGNGSTVLGAFAQAPGQNDVVVGVGAGMQLGSGSYNIDIGSEGNFGDSGIIRIGTPGFQTNTFLAGTVYASGGFAMTSDRNAKENFTSVNARQVLARVAALPITEWNYKTDAATQKHIGPMAQDFHAAFGVNGSDDKHISVIDEGGVALAAIKGLNQEVREQQTELEQKQTEITELKAQLDKIEALLNHKLNGGAK